VEGADAPRPRCGTAVADRRAALQTPHLPLLLRYQSLTTSVADPSHFGMDPDPEPDPDIFAIDLQNANKFSAYYWLKVYLHLQYIIFKR
jgi:hypothetical protein